MLFWGLVASLSAGAGASLAMDAVDIAPLARGHAFLEASFDGPDALRGWTGPGRLEGDGRGSSLTVQSSSTNRGGMAGAVKLKSSP